MLVVFYFLYFPKQCGIIVPHMPYLKGSGYHTHPPSKEPTSGAPPTYLGKSGYFLLGTQSCIHVPYAVALDAHVLV